MKVMIVKELMTGDVSPVAMFKALFPSAIEADQEIITVIIIIMTMTMTMTLTMIMTMTITRISLSEIKEHDWVTMYGLNPLLKEEENCQLIEVRIF